MERLARHAATLHAAGVPVVLAGDYNVVPTDATSIRPSPTPRMRWCSRKAAPRSSAFSQQGWTDAIRTLHPDAPMYTFWDYMRNRWPRDAGLRIDHLLLSPQARERLVAAGVDRDVRGEEGASDHAPAWIVLRDATASGTTRRPAKAKRQRRQSRAAATKPRSSAAAAGDRRRLVRAPLLSRAAEDDPAARRQRPAGAILGFANFLLRLYRREQPRAVLVAWDTLEVPTYRHEAFPAYQSGREFDDALVEQLEVLPEFVAACGFANAKAPGYEADDFLAAAAAAEERRGGRVLVASGDRDTFQLASERTTILYPVRAGEMARVDPAEVRARYGVDPAQVPDFIALRGDPSDKLPGAPAWARPGAAALLRKYGTLEAMLEAGRFPAQAEKLRLFRRIATMDRKAPLPPLRDQTPTWRQGRRARAGDGSSRSWRSGWKSSRDRVREEFRDSRCPPRARRTGTASHPSGRPLLGEEG